MKKIFVFAALCAVILVLLTSCSGRSLKRFNFDYPLDFHAQIKFDGRDYEANVSLSGEADMRIAFTKPESLKNTVLEIKSGNCYLRVSGITLPITDGGYSSENGLLLIRDIFSLPHSSYTDANVITSSGIKYCVENYKTKDGNVSAYFAEGKTLPDKISAVLRGHEIEITIVNE